MQVNVERKNVKYGGMNPAVTNVYFTQGAIDPWRTMGIQTDLNDRSPADVIPGTTIHFEIRDRVNQKCKSL